MSNRTIARFLLAFTMGWMLAYSVSALMRALL